VYIRYQ
jgi:serine/threonine protein kinase